VFVEVKYDHEKNKLQSFRLGPEFKAAFEKWLEEGRVVGKLLTTGVRVRRGRG
jgi:hypothetical protein